MSTEQFVMFTVAVLIVGLALGLRMSGLRHRSSTQLSVTDQLVRQQTSDQAVLRDGLERLADQLRDLEHQRVTWQTQLHEQVHQVMRSTDSLRSETSALSSALRRPAVRGKWGELQLRRCVELAGLNKHCDFTEQARLATDNDGYQHPDLIVHLAGGRNVVIDAKVPLDGLLDASQAAPSTPQVEQSLSRHAQQLRRHVDGLSSKRYWQQLSRSPEFVVLFLPAEAFLSAALELAPDLLDYAAKRNVVLATPTTLIALLRTVAYGWREDALSHRAEEIRQLGVTLYQRLTNLNTHLDQVGRSMGAAVTAYNQAVGSYESRVLVTARQLAELDPVREPLASPRQVTTGPRTLRPGTIRRATPEDPPQANTVAL
jgi:DNA recombination protein RmuC